MKGRAIYGGEELRFDTNRMIEARESNSSTLKEIVIDAAMIKAKNMKVSELREMLLIALPDKKRAIAAARKVAGHSGNVSK